MTSFKEILEKFDRTLRTYNPKNYSRLQPSNCILDKEFSARETRLDQIDRKLIW